MKLNKAFFFFMVDAKVDGLNERKEKCDQKTLKKEEGMFDTVCYRSLKKNPLNPSIVPLAT